MSRQRADVSVRALRRSTKAARYRTMGDQPVTSLPGFEESLRLLVERERYSQTDIALMFGVSRERVRQWCAARGIGGAYAKGLNAVRVWDDERHQFRPVSRRQLSRDRIEMQRTKRAEWRAERKRRVVACVAALRAALGRDPSWLEMAEALGLPTTTTGLATVRVLAYWDTQRRSTRERLRAFRLATGTHARRVGRPPRARPVQAGTPRGDR